MAKLLLNYHRINGDYMAIVVPEEEDVKRHGFRKCRLLATHHGGDGFMGVSFDDLILGVQNFTIEYP